MIVFVIHSRLRRRWESEGAPRVAAEFGENKQVQAAFTEARGHATHLACQAAAGGAAVVVAVGGDGTLNEVVNGIMQWAEAACSNSGGSDSCGLVDAAISVKSEEEGGDAPMQPPARGEVSFLPPAQPSNAVAAATDAAATPPPAATGEAAAAEDAVTAAAAAGLAPAAQLPVLGVLPWGTGNDFARTLGLLSKEPLASLLAVLRRPPTPISVCRLTCQSEAGNEVVRRYFANIAGCGVSASAARLLPALRWLGSGLVYTLAGGLALLFHRRLPMRFKLDGEAEWRELLGLTLVAAGQGRFFAGGMQILPGADPTKGALHVMTVEGLGMMRFAWYQRRLRRGEVEGVRGISIYTGTRVELCRSISTNAGANSGEAAGRKAQNGGGGGESAGSMAKNGVCSSEAACATGDAPAHADSVRGRPRLRLGRRREQGKDEARRYLGVECDGEVVGCAPMAVEVLPAAIRCCIP